MVIKATEMTDEDYEGIMGSGLFSPDTLSGFNELMANITELTNSVANSVFDGNPNVPFEVYQMISFGVTSGVFYAIALADQYPELFSRVSEKAWNTFGNPSKIDQAKEATLYSAPNVLTGDWMTTDEYVQKVRSQMPPEIQEFIDKLNTRTEEHERE